MKEKLKDLLDLNNSFYTFCKKIGWVFLMNLLFIITSIPVITIGASATAMYTVFNKMIDEREFSFFGDYFRAFRDNFLISTAVWLPELLITVALFLNTLYVFNSMSGAFGIIMRIGTVLLLIANALIANMLFPLIARFDITIKELIPTVFQMLTEHPGLAAESVLFTGVIFGGCLGIILSGWFLGLFILFPLISFGLHAFMQSYLYKKLFRYYMEEEEEDPDYVLGYSQEELDTFSEKHFGE